MTRARTPRPRCVGRYAASKCSDQRRHFLMILRQRDPALNAEHSAAARSHIRRRAFGVRDAATRRHEIHGPGRDVHVIAFAVAVRDAAIEKVGDGGKPDMRVGTNVQTSSGNKLHRSHLVEKNEGPDHLAFPVRQRPADGKAVAKVAHARNDDQFKRVARMLVAQHGSLSGTNSSLSPKIESVSPERSSGARLPSVPSLRTIKLCMIGPIKLP